MNSRHEVEIQECRQQLKQALAEEKEIADEIERAKRVLQLERGASARRTLLLSALLGCSSSFP